MSTQRDSTLMHLGLTKLVDFFINLIIWPLVFLQPLNLQECTIFHLKDLIHICLALEVQGYGMTFNMCYVSSKYTEASFFFAVNV